MWIWRDNGLIQEIQLPDEIGVRPKWNSYELLDSSLNGVNFKIAFPEKANDNRGKIIVQVFSGK